MTELRSELTLNELSDRRHVVTIKIGHMRQYLIPFTEYKLPNGRQVDMDFPCYGDDLAEKAQAILDAGFRFDIEILRNGIVSATIGGQKQWEEGDEPEDGDVAMLLFPNGPDVPRNIRKLIMAFNIPEDGVCRVWKKVH